LEDVVVRSPPLHNYLDARAVARLFSLSPRSLWRWRSDPELGFPEPDLVINNRLFWKTETIAGFQARQAARGTVTQRQTRRRPAKTRR
jgi:hypothetical protein